jgi:hypothetical protein
MSSNRFEDDADRQAYEALVKRNQLYKQPTSIRKGWGGVVGQASDLPGYKQALRDELMTALAQYTDAEGNVTIAIQE